MNILTEQTRSEVVEIGFPWQRQIRMSPDLLDLVKHAKGANVSMPDWITECIAIRLLMDDIIGLRLQRVIHTAVGILGQAPYESSADALPPTNVGTPIHPHRPPTQMSLKTALVAVGKRGR